MFHFGPQVAVTTSLANPRDDFAVNDGVLNIEGGNRGFYFWELAAQILFVSGEYPGLIAAA